MDKQKLIKEIKKCVSLYPNNKVVLTEDETENNRFFDGENEEGEDDGELHGVLAYTSEGAEMNDGDFWNYEEFSQVELENIYCFLNFFDNDLD